jgi:hypothetical protein
VARPLARQILSTIVVFSLAHLCYAGQGGQALKINPFVRPLDSLASQAQSVPPGQVDAVPLVLRGTMVAGQQSLANISGVIVFLGEEINGYTLVAIRQREVVLIKDDKRRILSVDAKSEGR